MGKDQTNPRPRGRPQEFAAQITLRLSAQQIQDIAVALDEGEERADFIRVAIEREIKRRSRAPRR